MSGTPEPWRVTIGSVRKRLKSHNPAVLAALDEHLESWEAALRSLVAQGATDSEIWQGEWTDLLPIPLRRDLSTLLLDVRAKHLEDNVTPDAVRAERARRVAAGEQIGYDALADHFHVSATTIKRRLGAPGPK